MNKDNHTNNEEIQIAIEFKERLYNLLGTIKLYFNYYPAVRSSLEVIIKKIEEIVILISTDNNQLSNEEQKSNESVEVKIFELFYVLFNIETNTTFYDLFFKTFQKFLKKLKKNPNRLTIQNFVNKYSSYFNQIYETLIKMKIKSIGLITDCTSQINLLKSINMLIDLFYQFNININEIKPVELYEFFIKTNQNLYTLTEQNINFSLVEDFSKLFNKTFKVIFNLTNQRDSLEKILNLLLDKIINISIIKKDSKKNLDDEEQNFHVDTLIISLKLCMRFFKVKDNCIQLSYVSKLKLTKCLVELSSWDNPKIVNYTCKIFQMIWKIAISIQEFSMRNELEIVFDFIYLRRFKEYYDSIKKIESKEYSDDSAIKLAVIEILARSLNSLIEMQTFLPILYLSTDLIQIRQQLIDKTFNSIQQYFNLNSSEFDYLKQLLLISNQIIFNIIKSNAEIIKSQKDSLSFYEKESDKWMEIVKLINQGNFKALYKYLCSEFTLTPLEKNAKIDILSLEMKEKYNKIAKALAILIRYSRALDINQLYETLGGNHALSKLILEEYVKTFNFKDLDIIQAYELFVSTFKLTGEQFHIFNFINQFSHKFFIDNQNKEKDTLFYFKKEEEVFPFAYSVMILNTDLHNPNVSVHMSCDEFIKNNTSSGLFSEVPIEYFKQIYDSILREPLKVAKPRSDTSLCSEVLYLDLNSRHIYIEQFLKEQSYKGNFLNEMCNWEDLKDYKFPYLNLFENLYCDLSNKNIENIIYSCYSNIFEELFCNVFTLPQSFFESNKENVENLLCTICDICNSFNKKEKINKIITTISSIMKKSDNINIYNLFFGISIKYSKEFHSNLEIYYQAILDVISHKLKEEKNPMRLEYKKLIDEIIIKTYSVIKAKEEEKNENSGIINYLFFSNAQPKNGFSFDDFSRFIYKKLGLNQIIFQNENEKLIDISEILNILKSQEEEFIFFVTLAASKILDYQNKVEFYISLVFLKEILKNISQKNFIKIWQNLYNIFKSQMEFKKESDENLFDMLYSNYFLHQIIFNYFPSIEHEDYCQLIENYNEIINPEILFIILENNDSLIKIAIEHHKFLNDKIFETLITLLLRLFNTLSNSMQRNKTSKNPIAITKYIKCIDFLTNIIKALKDISILLPDSLELINKCIQNFYELNLVNFLLQKNLSFNRLCVFIQTLTIKMKEVLPLVNDDKWSLYIYLSQFIFKCILSESEQAQSNFMECQLSIYEKTKIPLVRYNQLINILTNWYQPFVCLKRKYETFWEDIIKIFYYLFLNNEELANSYSELENLWSLYMKKYIISYIDQMKLEKREVSKKSKEMIKTIYEFVHNIVVNNFSNGNMNSISGKIIWWESTKNSIKLYFPEMIREEKEYNR